jgi:hypothetical protein
MGSLEMCRVVAEYRSHCAEAELWASGYGPLHHGIETQARLFELRGKLPERAPAGSMFGVLGAADRIASASMWLVAHALCVSEQGENRFQRGLSNECLDRALAMVPAFTGYLAANAISGDSARGCFVRRGCSREAVEAVNFILCNLGPDETEGSTQEADVVGRYLQACRRALNGQEATPTRQRMAPAPGSGARNEAPIVEFSDMPWPSKGSRMVALLDLPSLGDQLARMSTFLKQTRPDGGVLVPIVILPQTGRAAGGSAIASLGKLGELLKRRGYEPLVFDGSDPAAHVWAIFEIEARWAKAMEQGVQESREDRPLPIGIALATRQEDALERREMGTLIGKQPREATESRDFEGANSNSNAAGKFWVPLAEVAAAAKQFQKKRTQEGSKTFERPSELRI